MEAEDGLEEQGKQSPDDSSLLGGDHLLLGKFAVCKVLGKGAQSQVYLAEDKQLSRQVALKVIRLQAGESDYQRFAKETQILSSLEHQSIVRVYQHGRLADGRGCLVMEYLHGKTLEEILKLESTLSYPLFYAIFKQLLEALDYMHEKGVLHRDLKPANIMIVESENADGIGSTSQNKVAGVEVKLFDFGIAKVLGAESSNGSHTQGPILGSAAYMSPEQCAGKELDRRSDLYSLACIMYECLLGKVPFAADTTLETMYKQMNQELSKSTSKLPHELAAFLSKALSKDPNLRHLSARQMLDQLPAGMDLKKGKTGGSSRRGQAAFAALTLLILSGTILLLYIQRKAINPDLEIKKSSEPSETMKKSAALLFEMANNKQKTPLERLDLLKKTIEVPGAKNRISRLLALKQLITVHGNSPELTKPFLEQMYKEIQEIKDSDVERERFACEYYLSLAETYRKEPDKLIETADKGIALALRLPEDVYKYQMLCSLMDCKNRSFEMYKRYKELEENVRKQLPYAALLNRRTSLVVDKAEGQMSCEYLGAQFRIATAMIGQGRKKEALSLIEEIGSQVKTYGSQVIKLTYPCLLVNLVNSCQMQKDYELSRQLIESAEAALARNTGEMRFEAEGPLYLFKANNEIEISKDKAKAFVYLKKAFALHQKTLTFDMGNLLNIGRRMELVGEFASAEKVFRYAQKKFAENSVAFAQYAYYPELELIELRIQHKDRSGAIKELDAMEKMMKTGLAVSPSIQQSYQHYRKVAESI